MSYPVKNGQASVVLRFKLLDSSSTVGAGLTGLTSASSGLIISTIAVNEATATAYTVAGSTIETISTLGTYAAPTATKCRFKEVDATNHKGVYEFQFDDTRFAVSNAKSLLISVLGATNLAQADFVVPLVSDDPYVAKPANFALLSVDGSGRLDVIKVAGTTQTARDLGTSVLLSAGTGTGQLDFTSGVVKSNLTQSAGATVPAGAIPNAVAGAAGGLFIAGTNAATTVTTALTTTFTGNLTGSVGSATGSVGSVTGAVGSVAGNVDGNVTGTVAGVTPATVANILTTALTEAYAADGAAATLSQLLYMIWSMQAEKAVSGTTLTAKKLDGSTSAMTFTLNDASSPTSITRS